MKYRDISDPILFSNLLFFINAMLYGFSGFYSLFILFSLSTVFSFRYHMDFEKNKMSEVLDVLFAKLSLCGVLIHLALYAKVNQIIGCLLFLFFCLMIKEIATRFDNDSKEYTIAHTLWHIGVFIGNIGVYAFIR